MDCLVWRGDILLGCGWGVGGRGGGGDCQNGRAALYTGDAPQESPIALNDSPLIFFSLDDARKLVAERDRLRRQYEEVSRKVDALSVLVPEHLKESIFGTGVNVIAPTAPPAADVQLNGHVRPAPALVAPSMGEFIVQQLDETLKVVEQDQIEEMVWSNPYYSDKHIYSAETIGKVLEKLSRRGRVGKKGMRYYSKNAKNIPEISFNLEGTTVIKAVERVLRESNESLEAWEVINKLKDDSQVGEKVRNNQNGIYAALSRLTSRRIAYRDLDGYRIGAK